MCATSFQDQAEPLCITSVHNSRVWPNSRVKCVDPHDRAQLIKTIVYNVWVEIARLDRTIVYDVWLIIEGLGQAVVHDVLYYTGLMHCKVRQ
jgi:hypothetical protein